MNFDINYPKEATETSTLILNKGLLQDMLHESTLKLMPKYLVCKSKSCLGVDVNWDNKWRPTVDLPQYS